MLRFVAKATVILPPDRDNDRHEYVRLRASSASSREDEYPRTHEHAQQHLSGFGRGAKGAFELVLDLILDGLERMKEAA